MIMSANDAVLDEVEVRPTKTWMVWGGRVLSAVPVLMMTMSAAMKLSHQPVMAEMFTRKFGYSASALTGIGLLELLTVVLYAIPRTAILGAVLVTGYLGGAIATHVRIGEAFGIPLVLGILVWAGLYLRDERVRALLPLRNS
jgi:DoxX-like protein